MQSRMAFLIYVGSEAIKTNFSILKLGPKLSLLVEEYTRKLAQLTRSQIL